MADYRQALAIDPGYAAAWSGLSVVCSRQADSGMVPIDEGYRLAREAGDFALILAEAQRNRFAP